ncbi:MAG: CBS domain-containing protein [Bdellovibrionales bacterium]|nr:CBS domain-containing protein [Bdellovibrionales bacterium]
MSSKAKSVGAVMTPYPYSVSPNDPPLQVRNLMAAHAIRHVPVVEGGKPVSVITDRDISLALSVFGDAAAEGSIPLEQICTMNTYMVDASDNLEDVVSHMIRNHIGSALVLENKRLAGIFTMTDACKYLLEILRQQEKLLANAAEYNQ